MSIDYKPEGYTSLAPYLVVPSVQRVVDFLKQAFGATELRRFDKPDGSVIHAEVKVDDTVVMMADASPEFPAFPVWMHLYVKDVDAAYQRALDAGGVAVQPPKQSDGDPDKRGGVKDPGGNTWWVSTQGT